jgi:lysophospholipase-1
MSMPGWYDISKLGRDVRLPHIIPYKGAPLTAPQLDFEEAIRTQDEAGILKSRDYFNTLIKEQMDKGIKSNRIVLGGFSQGGAMSVFSGLTNKEKLGGVFGLSCYMLLSDRIKNYTPENWPNKDTPFFLAHGDEDEVVPHAFGQKSAEMLKSLGVENVEFNTYPYVLPQYLWVVAY